jgi:putative OPT family oligopeptide transporter
MKKQTRGNKPKMIKDTNKFHPYISDSDSLPELTVKAIILGFVLAAVLAGSTAYLGLKMGQTVSASIPAAVISMTVLRMFGRTTILENNIVQTIASAGYVLSSGIIFTIPALIVMGYWQQFNYWQIFWIAIIGGLLGALFSIPLRRTLIISEKLKFPEGVAAAEVLKAGDKVGTGESTGIGFLAAGAACSSITKFCQSGLHIFAETIQGWINVGGSVFGMGVGFAFSMIGAGYIVGMKVAFNLIVGAAIAWFVGVPLYTAFFTPQDFGLGPEASAFDLAMAVRTTKLRYIGVGTMIFGGLYTLFSLVGPIRTAIKSSFSALQKARMGASIKILRTDYDIPFTIVIMSVLALSIPIFFIIKNVIGDAALPISSNLYWIIVSALTVFSLIIGFICASIGGYMAGIVGSSANPLSGITIGSILAFSAALMLILTGEITFGGETKEALSLAASVVMIGGIVACSAALSCDNLQDLKAGYVLGATPWRQQVALMIGVVAGALVIAPILQILYEAYGLGDSFPRLGMDPEHALAAPQATLMASVAKGVFLQVLDWPLVFIGVGIGAGILILDQLILKPLHSEYRLSVMAVALGIYLPIDVIMPLVIGGLINYLARARLKSHRHRHGVHFPRVESNTERQGLLFASGLIAGDALLGILLAIPFAAYQSTSILSIVGPSFKDTATVLGLLMFSAVGYYLYRLGWQEKVVTTEI